FEVQGEVGTQASVAVPVGNSVRNIRWKDLSMIKAAYQDSVGNRFFYFQLDDVSRAGFEFEGSIKTSFASDREKLTEQNSDAFVTRLPIPVPGVSGPGATVDNKLSELKNRYSNVLQTSVPTRSNKANFLATQNIQKRSAEQTGLTSFEYCVVIAKHA